MNLQLRKSFNDSPTIYRNNSKKNSRIGYFLHNQKKLPTIVINSKNSELTEFGKVSNYSKSFYKQRSLNLSETQNIPCMNKNPSSNLNLRKKASNLLNIKNQFNNNNNLDTLNSSIIEKSSKKSINNYNIFQSEDNYLNQALKFNIGMNINPLSTLKLKNPNDFDVSEEDKIFNLYKSKNNEKSKIKKGKKKKIKLKKKKIKTFSSYNAALVKVYKKMPKIISNIEYTKKLKGAMSLYKYQNLLMDVGAKNLNRETRDKLNNKFINLRNFSEKTYNLIKESLDSIETKEKEIIESINTQQNYYKRKMKENKYYTITSSRNSGLISLPNLKFHKIGKSQKICTDNK